MTDAFARHEHPLTVNALWRNITAMGSARKSNRIISACPRTFGNVRALVDVSEQRGAVLLGVGGASAPGRRHHGGRRRRARGRGRAGRRRGGGRGPARQGPCVHSLWKTTMKNLVKLRPKAFPTSSHKLASYTTETRHVSLFCAQEKDAVGRCCHLPLPESGFWIMEGDSN